MITWLKKLFKKEVHINDTRMAIPNPPKYDAEIHNVFCLLWHSLKGGLTLHQLTEYMPGRFIWFPVLGGRLISNSYEFEYDVRRFKELTGKVYIKLPSNNFLTNPEYGEELENFRQKHISRIMKARKVAKAVVPNPPTPPNSRIWVDSDLATKKPMDPKYKNALEELNALVGKKRNDSR